MVEVLEAAVQAAVPAVEQAVLAVEELTAEYGTSGTNAAQSTRGQSSPSGNTAAQPPGQHGPEMAFNSQVRELGRGTPVPA